MFFMLSKLILEVALFSMVTMHFLAGSLYCSGSELFLSGSGTFVGNEVGLNHSMACGTAIFVHASTTSPLLIHNSKPTKNYSHRNCGGTTASSESLVPMQGAIHFSNYSNRNGGTIFLHNTKCLITGHVLFAGNAVTKNCGAIKAMDTSLNIQE